MKKQKPMTLPLDWQQLSPLAAAMASAGLMSLAHAAPQDGIVRAGNATISGGGSYTRIDQTSNRAVIDWRSFSIGTGERVQFAQPSTSSATLNRVTGSQVSTLLGRLDANGQILLVNPNGIIIGKSGQINVGSLIASTSNITNDNFMAGRLVFDQPGKPGAGILNAGSITAAEGGLVALVAPHVRNDGLIQARLGKVMLGAADTFTIDLYGDQLVNLALSDSHIGQLFDANGQPVQSLITQAGRIDAGQAVLVTAATARNVLDNLINMSGTIKAETAVHDGGRIVLLGEGGKINVSGTLDASGNRGGQIEVLGQNVNLTSSANINANGANGGGTIHVGGAWQGGATYRAQNTAVEAGANLTANALANGNGGEVVVWADGHTAFAGNVEAKGGALSGNGGRMEVSGKGTLAFSGTANASAPNGVNGSLLLDPTVLDVGVVEANAYNTTLRTGTSIALQADVDININSIIDGRDGTTGGAITMTAGNNINLNDFVVTNNGGVNLFTTTGAINIAANKGIFSGTAPITLSAGGNLVTGPLITNGTLSLESRAGSIALNSPITSSVNLLTINSALDVDINQPLTYMANGHSLTINAGRDIRVGAAIDGRGGVAGGALSLLAGQHLSLNDFIVTNNGAVNLRTTTALGDITMATNKGVFSGNAPITISAGRNLFTGPLISTGNLSLESRFGSIAINSLIDKNTHLLPINAAIDVDINQPIASLANGDALTITAGHDIKVNAQIDGRGGSAAGGAVNFIAGNNINVNDHISTNNGAVNLTATNGTVLLADGKQVNAGAAPINITTGGNFATAAQIPPVLNETDLANYVTLFTSGALTMMSTNGSVTINAPTSETTGTININAANAITVNQKLNTNNQNITLTAGPGGITINEIVLPVGIMATIDSLTGNLILSSAGNINLNGGIASATSVSLNTGGQIIADPSKGGIFRSKGGDPNNFGLPTTVTLVADQGIVDLSFVGRNVTATSSSGPIGLRNSFGVDTLSIDNHLCATCDVSIASQSTAQNYDTSLTINAGGNISFDAYIQVGFFGSGTSGLATLTAGKSILFSTGAFQALQINATAGESITNLATVVAGDLISGASNFGQLTGTATFNAAKSFLSLGRLAFGNLDLTASGPAIGLGTIYIDSLDTLGAVKMRAPNGDIQIASPIGHYQAATASTYNPTNKGVSSVDIQASGDIVLNGVRRENVAGTALITSVNGNVSSTYGITNTTVQDPNGTTNDLGSGSPVSGTNGGTFTDPDPSAPNTPNGPSAGPTVPAPSAPSLLAGSAPGSPSAFPEILVDAPALTSLLALAPTGAGGGGSTATGGSTGSGATDGGSTTGGSTSTTGTTDATTALRAAQVQTGSTDNTANTNNSPLGATEGGADALGAGSNAPAGKSVACPPGVAPGSTVVTIDASGAQVSVACN